MLPDFFVIGAQKAGSTYLLHCLEEHPQIFMPRYEVPFFEDAFYDPARLGEFEAHFAEARSGQIVGVKRPNVLGHPECPPRLHRHMPKLKLIVILRHPVERAISGYFHYMKTGLIPIAPIEEGFPKLLEGQYERFPRAGDIIEFGMYARHLANFEQEFPRENIHVVLMDDIRRDAELQLRRTYAFLGVDPDFRPPSAESRPMSAIYSIPRLRLRYLLDRFSSGLTADGRYVIRKRGPLAASLWAVNSTIDRQLWARLFPAGPPKLPTELRSTLEAIYRDDIEALERWLDRDLPHWTRGTAQKISQRAPDPSPQESVAPIRVPSSPLRGRGQGERDISISDRRIHCVHYLDSCRLEQGGVVQAVLYLLTALAERGHSIELLTLDPGDVPECWLRDEPGVPRVTRLDESRLGAGLLSGQGKAVVRRLLAHADLVHLHTPWALGNRQVASMACRAKLPYIVTVHGMLDDWSMGQKSFKKRLYLAAGGRRMLQGARRLHFTAEAERDQALKYVPVPLDAAAIVPLVLDLQEFFAPAADRGSALPSAPPKATSGAPSVAATILFLSRLHPKKGVELLIEASAVLRDQGLSFRLQIAGPGETSYVDRLKRMVTEHALDDRCDFLGMVRGGAKRELYRSAGVFVLPTQQENFGIVLVEAMACGLPVVTTRGTDIWRELESGGAVIVQRTPGELAAAMARLLRDPEDARRRGEKGRMFVSQWLDRTRVIDDMESLYGAASAIAP